MADNSNDPIDVEDDFDLPGDDWSDLDEDARQIKPAARSPKNKSDGRQKSFLSKNLNAIVIGIAAIAGGAYFFGPHLMSGSANVTAPQEVALEVPQDDQLASAVSPTQDSDAVPQPVPMSTDAPSQNLAEIPVQDDSGGLVPLPVPEAVSTEGEDATGNSGQSTALLAEGAAQGHIQDSLTDAAPPTQPAPDMIAGAPPSNSAPVTPVEIGQASTLADSAASAKIDVLENELANVREAIAARADQMDARINELAQNMADISKKMDALAAVPRSASDAVVAPTSAPVAEEPQAEEILKSVPAPAGKPKTKSASKRKPSKPARAKAKVIDNSAPAAIADVQTTKLLPVVTRWQLRSARPGAAVISQSGSSEMRDITVGDRVDGIGTVRSIVLENRVWIVRGTRGEIRR